MSHLTNNRMCSVGGAGGGIPAKDQAGNIVKASEYLEKYPKGDVHLSQGLKVRFALGASNTRLRCCDVVMLPACADSPPCPFHGYAGAATAYCESSTF